MCRSSEDHVPSLGERQGHTRTSRARVCVYSSCPPPPLPLRCGRGGGGFRTEGMRPAKQPDAFTPPPPALATAAPCVCDRCRFVPCTVCLSSRHLGIAQLLWRHQIPPPSAAATTKTLPCTQVCVVAPQVLTDLRVRLPPESGSPPFGPIGPISSVRQCREAVSCAPCRRVSPTASMLVRLLSVDWAARVCG